MPLIKRDIKYNSLQFFIHLTNITAPLIKQRLIRKAKRELWNTLLLSVIAVFQITLFVILTQPGHGITYKRLPSR